MKRILTDLAGLLAGALLGQSLFWSAVSVTNGKELEWSMHGPLFAPVNVLDVSRARCDEMVQLGMFYECRINGIVDYVPENKAVYGQYVVRVSTVGSDGEGDGFFIVMTENGEVVGVH